MNDTDDQLFDLIESNYPIEQIQWKGHCIWPVFKLAIVNELEKKSKRHIYLKRNPSNIFLTLKSLFYGFSCYFKRYNTLVFSQSSFRTLLNGKYVQRNVEDILSPEYKSLLIEHPLPKGHFPKKQILNKDVISLSPFFIFTPLCLALLKLIKPKFEGKKVLDNIIIDNELSIDCEYVFYKLLCQYYYTLLLLKIFKPKSVVVLCYYGVLGQILACKKKGIKVIEAQHGFMVGNPMHSFAKYIDNNLVADELWAFGEYSKAEFVKSNFMKADSIKISGSYILKEIRKLSCQWSVKKTQQKKVAFSAQDIFIDEVLDFLAEVLKLNKEIIIYYIPRGRNKELLTRTKELINTIDNDRLILVENKTIYELILDCDFHCTIFSTTAVESLSLGKPNILININGLAEKHLGFLKTNPFVYFVSSSREVGGILKTSFDSDDIAYSARDLFYVEEHKTITL